MTALKPIENRRVRAVSSERYPLNKKCAHPECRENAVDPHHAFPRSAIGGDSWFVEIASDAPTGNPDPSAFGGHPYSPLERQLGYGSEFDPRTTTVIPHVTGLCREHHDDAEEHRAWIKLEDGVWNWYDRTAQPGKTRTPEQTSWDLVGPLNPQPGSVEGKTKRKRYQGQERRQRKVISVRVPDDADENGAGLLDEAVEALEEKISPGDHRPIYYTLMSALVYTLLNADETDFE